MQDYESLETVAGLTERLLQSGFKLTRSEEPVWLTNAHEKKDRSAGYIAYRIKGNANGSLYEVTIYLMRREQIVSQTTFQGEDAGFNSWRIGLGTWR